LPVDTPVFSPAPANEIRTYIEGAFEVFRQPVGRKWTESDDLKAAG
jgi:hypothetical protein